MSLLIPIPTLIEPLSNQPLSVFPKLTVLEKPIKVSCGVVTFSDGKTFEQSQQAIAGFFIYRQQVGVTEIWNEEMKLWSPDPGTALTTFKPKPLAYQPSTPAPWQGLLVPAAEKDTGFNTASSYDYFIRIYCVSNPSTGSVSGLSPPSSRFKFTSLMNALRAGIKPRDGSRADDTEEIQLFLRNPNLQIIGSVKITSNGGSAQIDIQNQNTSGNPLAIVQLLSNGDIVLKPAIGRKVIVEGFLETGEITYTPSGGGSKKTLA